MFSEFGSECREDSGKKEIRRKVPEFSLTEAALESGSLEAMKIRQHLRKDSMSNKIPNFCEGGEL